jgi:putative ABC transport system ATP-binding protein
MSSTASRLTSTRVSSLRSWALRVREIDAAVCLSGMDGLDSGNVVFDGVDLSAAQRQRTGRYPPDKNGLCLPAADLLRNLNILDNIILPSMRDGSKNGARLAEKAKMLMEKTGIAGLEMRDSTQASGGQLQRVGICRALMSDPKIIFGDEPTGALNSTSCQRDHGAAG